MFRVVCLLVLCALGVAADDIIVGNVRVQALSKTLVRIEPMGPRGFENRTTFMVFNREWSESESIPIRIANQSGSATWLSTEYYDIYIEQVAPNPGTNCSTNIDGMDVLNGGERSPTYPNGASHGSVGDCCAACQQDQYCTAYVFDPTAGLGQINCWPLNSYMNTISSANRIFGTDEPGSVTPITHVTVSSPDGTVLFDQQGSPYNTNKLFFPAPLQQSSYMITDYPRFYAPWWGPAPIPSNETVDPALNDTNGYDFRNNQFGDMYVFLLGDDMDSWTRSRLEFIHLTGPTPLLPDYAYGTWFTWWHQYTQAEAQYEVQRWRDDNLPIDVWALDMNWRNTSNFQNRVYDHPNTALFPDFDGWFQFLQNHSLRTYFNDHPFPVAMQTDPKEIAFRWEGLTSWMERGLTYWWFDRNWDFSVPPPNVQPIGGWNASYTGGSWEGLSNAAWGSHLYHTVVSEYTRRSRPATFPRAITLTKFDANDWRPGMDPHDAMQNPAQHRYPVWWTGDGVVLQASVESMVDSGIYSFKPFVHSDCGGDAMPGASNLLRWTAHCAFGTIHRFHGADHRPWTFGNATEDIIREYLDMRYKLLPTFIAAGQQASLTGFPLVARGDLYWSSITYPEAASNQQYIHLNDTLVAPVWQTSGTRSVWIPPGTWQYTWDGSSITGPQTITLTTPSEQQPMWHRVGGLLVTATVPGLRVDHQDWSSLTLEAWPDVSAGQRETVRFVYDKADPAYPRTDIVMRTTSSSDGSVALTLDISKAANSAAREWILRVHLPSGFSAALVLVDEVKVRVNTLEPLAEGSMEAAAFVPFGGRGTRPAPHSGPVVEVIVPMGAGERRVNAILAPL